MSDDDVHQLNALLARLRDSFGDCRAVATGLSVSGRGVDGHDIEIAHAGG